MINKEAADILRLMPKQSNAIKKAIEVLEQEPKTGHWIMLGEKDEIYCEEAKCSICGAIEVNAGYDNFCPNCGAKMESD